MTEEITQFTVGAITIAASRDAAIRAELLKVGDTVRVLKKDNYSGVKVSTGVIVGFEPFKTKPTIVVAYIESEYNNPELKMLYFNDASENVEILPAAPGHGIEIEQSKVLDHFDAEENKKMLEIEAIKAKRRYFKAYFGKVFAGISSDKGEALAIEA